MCNSEAEESLSTAGTGTPLVQLQAHDQRLVLEHYPRKLSSSGRYAVRLDSNNWVKKGTREPITRDVLMMALQRLQKILIRSTDLSGTATTARLQGVTLDIAVPSDNPNRDRRPKAMGVEMCKCPEKYNATSCQNPGNGNYRWHDFTSETVQTLLDFVGKVKPCQCNGRSEKCQPENGNCLSCRDNTTGPACEICAGGFYGNPLIAGGICRPCQCPDSQHNHAATCSLDSRGQFMCQCKVGYTGPRCDRCDYGYFGDSVSGCFPCDCNPMGSTSNQVCSFE